MASTVLVHDMTPTSNIEARSAIASDCDSNSNSNSDSDSDDNDHARNMSDIGNDTCDYKSTTKTATAMPLWESAKASLEARKKRKRPTASLLKNAMMDLDRIWMNANIEEAAAAENQQDLEANYDAQHIDTIPPSDMSRIRQTTDLLVKVFTKDIHEPAIRALVTNEELKASEMKLKSELESKQKEVERLRRSEQRSKEAIANFLKAVTDSAEKTNEASQWKLVEAKMREDLLKAIFERDTAKKDLLVSRRSYDRLGEEVENLKKDRIKLQHDKIRLEREVRAARALAEQLSSSQLEHGHHKNDLDYYKSKSKEQEIYIQEMSARLDEKNREIIELRRFNNRNLSLQRLDALKDGGSSSKRLRKSA